MGFDLGKRTTRPPAKPAVASRMRLFGVTTFVALFTLVGAAWGAWPHSGSGGAASKARAMPAGNTPTTSITGRNVTVSWSASSFEGGGPNVSDYTVKRYNTSGVEQAIGSGCSGTISALTCTESDVDPGSWKYSVTPKAGNWTGTESSQSAIRVVDPPSFSISSWANVNSLPSSLNGSLGNFKTGATVTYRLDNPTSGTVLSATTTPSTIGTNGSAGVSVTIPSGTSNGTHRVYAIGSSGDQVSARITVNVCASAGTQTLNPDADTYVREDGATGNFGTDTTMNVKSDAGKARRPLVHFALPSLGSGCSITAATLRLNTTAGVTGRTIAAYKAADSWTETGATWNNQPGTTGSAVTTASATSGYISWAVTSQVKSMYSGTNTGFLIKDANEASANSQNTFGTREGASNKPELVLTIAGDNDAKFSVTGSSTLTSLPGGVNGELDSFTPGSTVTYRLDDPTTGTLLSATTTPSTIPGNGQADASVTVPAGTTNGAHTIYALGSGGEVAAASITVAVPPVVNSAVIDKAIGGCMSGKVAQAGTYYVYANVSNTPATVTADVSAITTGQTSVALTEGSYSVNGASYNYRSAQLTATTPLSAGSKSYSVSGAGGNSVNGSVTVENTQPFASDVNATNVSGGTAGRAETGDIVTYTFSEAMDPCSLVPGWDGTGTTSVVVRIPDSAGNDLMTVWNSANTTQLAFGSVNTGDAVSGAMTFGVTGTPSSLSMSGGVVTITLGTSAGTPRTRTAHNMIWTPSTAAFDPFGNLNTAATATESGASDPNF